MSDLATTAEALVAPGKGILAADESEGTIAKRLAAVGVESTERTRRAYRDLLFTAAGASEHISGVILYDESLRQQSAEGTPFPALLDGQGIIPGIKVDLGPKPLALCPRETVTEGLDGLRARFAEYYAVGARFAKWRGVISIGDGIPTDTCLAVNAHALARYAALAQEAGLVPIVEPEVLMDGDHTLERSFDVTSRAQRALFEALTEQRVDLSGILLKPNMVLAGYDCPEQATVEQVAEATLRCLRLEVPEQVPGIVFLSGGQSDEAATEHLDAIARADGAKPWQLSFSYGRALQAAALEAWHGDPTAVPLA
ncbi:MAG TPA: class I fructose-bisphosphate aldolase, partial [Gaiellaceae bacterium]